MRNYIAAVVLSAGLLVAGTAPYPMVSAQGTKDKAKLKEAPIHGGHIEIGKGKDGKYRFAVRTADGKYLAGSSPIAYATEKEAREAIETFKKIVATAKVTVKDHKETKKPTKD